MTRLDAVVRGGVVVDGLGTPPRRVDVGIEDGRIAALGRLPERGRVPELDARDALVTPGFVDPLSHSHFTLLAAPSARSKVAQGVTLELEGENIGAGPIEGAARAWVEREGLRPLDLALTWRTIPEYVDRLSARGVALNVALTIPAGLVRACVAELDDPRPLSPSARSRARRLVEEGFRAGAAALTFNLPEVPCIHYTSDEVDALCRVAAAHDALCCFHVRDERAGLAGAVEEVIGIAGRTGARVEILHLKRLLPSPDRLEQTLDRVEEARRRGLAVSANAYPYTVAALALQELLEEGGAMEPRSLAARLRGDASFRAAARERLEGVPDSIWHRTYLADRADPRRGRSVGQLAEERGTTAPAWTVGELEDAARWVHCHCDHVEPDDLRRVFSRPWVAVGSDGSARDPRDRRTRRGPLHPRDSGTFPRAWRLLARGRSPVPVPERVRRMTSLPADRLRLKDRGRIREGCWADLVVLEPGCFEDRATLTNPLREPLGVRHVIVNGVPVIRAGAATGRRPGRFVSPARQRAGRPRRARTHSTGRGRCP